jgi:hypothetical protein
MAFCSSCFFQVLCEVVLSSKKELPKKHVKWLTLESRKHYKLIEYQHINKEESRHLIEQNSDYRQGLRIQESSKKTHQQNWENLMAVNFAKSIMARKNRGCSLLLLIVLTGSPYPLLQLKQFVPLTSYTSFLPSIMPSPG